MAAIPIFSQGMRWLCRHIHLSRLLMPLYCVGVPVFVDIRPDNLNIDESKIEAAITPRPKIVPVHYAGVGWAKHYGNCPASSVAGDWGYSTRASLIKATTRQYWAFSNYQLSRNQNVICGQGGVLLVNYPQWSGWDNLAKGTNRSQFLRGLVDKYSWVDIGSSYLLQWNQCRISMGAAGISRHHSKENRHLAAIPPGICWLEVQGKVRRPITDTCQHNAHMYYLLLPNLDAVMPWLRNWKLVAFHAARALHLSPLGESMGKLMEIYY